MLSKSLLPTLSKLRRKMFVLINEVHEKDSIVQTKQLVRIPKQKLYGCIMYMSIALKHIKLA